MTETINRSVVLKPIAYESGLGLMTRTAYRLGSSSAHSFMRTVCPQLRDGTQATTRASQLSSLMAWMGPEHGNDVDAVLSRYSNLSAVRFFTKYRLAAVPHKAITRGRNGSSDQVLLDEWWQPWGAGMTRRRFCRFCAQDQYYKFGFTTWLLPHQIGNVRACFDCDEWLYDQLVIAKSDLTLPTWRPKRRPDLDAAVPSEAIVEARLGKMLIDSNLPWFCHQARAKLFRERLTQLEDRKDRKLAQVYPMLALTSVRQIVCPGDDTAFCVLVSSMKLILAMYEAPQDFFDHVAEFSDRHKEEIEGLNNALSARERVRTYKGGVLSFRPLGLRQVL